MKFWQKRAFLLTMAGTIQFVILTIVAMLFYPGGTWVDTESKGYSFFNNLFSDLGMTVSHSGTPNGVARTLFTLTLVVAAISLVSFFVVMPKFFDQSKKVKRLSIIGSVFGVISGLAYVGIAVVPLDLFLYTHLYFVYAAFGSFTMVVIFYTIAIFQEPSYSNTYAYVFLAFASLLVVYMVVLVMGPSPFSAEGLRIQAVGQKFIVYAAIVCMFFQGYGAWRQTAVT